MVCCRRSAISSRCTKTTSVSSMSIPRGRRFDPGFGATPGSAYRLACMSPSASLTRLRDFAIAALSTVGVVIPKIIAGGRTSASPHFFLIRTREGVCDDKPSREGFGTEHAGIGFQAGIYRD